MACAYHMVRWVQAWHRAEDRTALCIRARIPERALTSAQSETGTEMETDAATDSASVSVMSEFIKEEILSDIADASPMQLSQQEPQM
jgi:hypothetical protein